MRENPPDSRELGAAETVARDSLREDTAVEGSDPTVAEDAALDATVASAPGADAQSISASGITVPVIGDHLGRYIVEDSLGAGGMGVVYRGFDPDLQRPVALKLLSPRAGVSSAGGSDSARARLMREAQAMAQLSHPNILTVHDVGIWGEQVYIAMELVRGVTLDEWRRAEPRSLESILEVFIQAAEGLQAAHSAGLVHRDFKPDNVLVDSSGRVRVMDFGLARYTADVVPQPESDRQSAPDASLEDSALPALNSPLTQVGALLGTPAYMSPEQFDGATVDARCDQFAFGVTLYEALYEQRPFSGGTVGELREAVTAGKQDPVPRNRSVPSWAQGVIERVLSTDPSNRFGTMGDLVRALNRGRHRRRRVLWALGLSLAFVVAMGTVLYFQHRSATSDAERKTAAKRALKKQAALKSAQQDRERLKRHLNLLRERRTDLLKKLVVEKDELKRHSLACRIAGLEDVIKRPGERITAREIRRALMHCMPVVKQCYLATLAKHPKVAGTIKVDFRTDRNGKVTQLTFPIDTVRVPMLTQCIYDVFVRWNFPTGGGDIDPLHVSYPFHFKPRK